MYKKFIRLLAFLPIILLLSVSADAEEYIFRTEYDFPMLFSNDGSVSAISQSHNLYTASSFEALQPLINSGLVTYYEPMTYSYLFDYTPSDTYYPSQTNLSLSSVPFAWQKGIFGENVKVAVIDSGLYQSASDFNFKKVKKVKDYTYSVSGTEFCNDTIGHGTRVAGIIGAAHNTWGISGIAPNVELYIFKCFYQNEYGNNVAKDSDIAAAMFEAIDTYQVDIINISAGSKNKTLFKEVCDYAAQKGVLVVAAVGNDGSGSKDTLYYPASLPNVIGVGSIKDNGHRAEHSQRNNYVNIMAPGENIYSVFISSYTPASGTSFATPHITSALALAKSLNPSLTAEELTTALYFTADQMTDRYSGYGSLNVQALLTYVRATLSYDAIITSSTDTTVYTYCIPSDMYMSYFALYDPYLSELKKYGYSAPKGTHYKAFLWKKGSLEPKNPTVIQY